MFEFVNSVKIITGKNCYEKLPYEILTEKCNSVLLLTDKTILGLGIDKRLEKIFTPNSIKIGAIFSDVPMDSSTLTVNEIAKVYLKNKCDCIVAVGGGSVIDTAKGVRLLLGQNSKNLETLQGNECIKRGIDVPFFVMPTTCGTGSECTSVAVIKNEKNEKIEYITPFVLPNVAFIDSTMIETLPNFLIAATSFDALSHSVEAIIGAQANPITDSFGLSAIKLIFENLLPALKNKKDENLQNLLLASNLAGIAFSNSMVGICHAIAHTLGSVCHISHANSISILLYQCLKVNFNSCKNQYAKIYDFALGSNGKNTEEKAKLFMEKIKELSMELRNLTGVKNQLNDYPITDEQIEKVSELSLNDGACVANKITVTKDLVKSILLACKNG